MYPEFNINPNPNKCALFILYLTLSTSLFAGEVYESFPEQIDPKATYLIYSHGRILEGNSSRPEHPRWGVYEFPEIRTALVKGENWILLGEHRTRETDVHLYSDQLVTWVQSLVKAGVKPDRITLIGFSKGGIITSLAASKLTQFDVNTVLLASCWGRSVRLPEFFLKGPLLSIYESSDRAGSCAYLMRDSGGKNKEFKEFSEFKELKINTGKEHGAFYRPIEEWVRPVKDWIGRKKG